MYRKIQCKLISPSQSHALGFIKVNIYALFRDLQCSIFSKKNHPYTRAFAMSF